MSKTDLKIRQCMAADFESLVPLFRELWPEKPIDPKGLGGAYLNGLGSDTQIYICAVSGLEVIAFGSLTVKNSLWQEGAIAHVEELVVRHDCRNRGIGRRLLAELEAIAGNRGCHRIELDSAVHEKNAHRFYEERGFENRAFLFSKPLSMPNQRIPEKRILNITVDAMTPADWPDVSAIYAEGIATGMATFETAIPSWQEWNAARLPHSRLVARDSAIVGWAALSPVSQRACYAGVAEIGIYVAARARKRGVGHALLEALISSAEAHGIWTLQGATIAENKASLVLQAKSGFRVVGRRERIGKLDGHWRDTILTERRSDKVGFD